MSTHTLFTAHDRVAFLVDGFKLYHSVLISGDTDIAPAIRAAKRLAPAIRLCSVFPYGRHNRELAQLVDVSFKMSDTAYAAHQLPDPLVLSNGRALRKPATW